MARIYLDGGILMDNKKNGGINIPPPARVSLRATLDQATWKVEMEVPQSPAIAAYLERMLKKEIDKLFYLNVRDIPEKK